MNGMMDHGHGHNYMGAMAPQPSSSSSYMPRHRRKMMMHMTFYWGNNAEVLFDGWPGRNAGMYYVSLVVVFLLALLVEWLSRCHLIKSGLNDVVAGLVRTLMHTVRMGLAYLAMLAVMSFNGGIFLAAIAGHAAGFLIFGTSVFNKPGSGLGPGISDLPPMSC